MLDRKKAPRSLIATIFLLSILFLPFAASFRVLYSTQSEAAAEFATSNAQEQNSTALRRAVFVSPDSNSYIDEFSYMAAVPTSVFNYDGTKYVSPVILSSSSDSQDWLIDDWADYLSVDGGLEQLLTIGDYSIQESMALRDSFGKEIFPHIEGDSSAEIAAQLALSDWTSSDAVVIGIANDAMPNLNTTSGTSTHSLDGSSPQSYNTSATVSPSSGASIPFTPPTDAGWLYGSFDWAGTDYFTHKLIDPNGVVIDYSLALQTRYQRDPDFVDELVPLHFWLPKRLDGEYTMEIGIESIPSAPVEMDCDISYYPGFSQEITVPPNTKWLNLTADWDNAGTNINLALMDPSGRMVQWAPAGSLLSGAGLNSIEIPYPRAGSWKAVGAWMDPNGETNNIELNWQTEKLQTNPDVYFESAANAAVLASLMNAPLLYTEEQSVPAVTLNALNRLDSDVVFLVDPYDVHSAEVESQLESTGILTVLENHPMVSDCIKNLSKNNDIVATVPRGTGNEFYPAAALSGAFHGAPVFSLCGEDNAVTTMAESTWAPYKIGPEIEIYVTSRYSTRTENGWYDDRIPNMYTMRRNVDTFESFLDERGAYNSSVGQSAVIISPINLIKPSFDRSLQTHFSPGRIPARNAELASVMISKAILHRFLFHTAESSDDTLLSLYAYTDGASYSDNFGNIHDIYQVEDTQSPLENMGFNTRMHVGVNEVFDSIASQVSLWALSTHGTLTRYPADPPARPNGVGYFSLRDADSPYGFEESVSNRESDEDNDRLVNPVAFPSEKAHHVMRTTDELSRAIDNIGSPIVFITACLLGGSKLPVTLMEHGAVGVMASPRTVYFRAAGLLSTLVIESLANGSATGNALTSALHAVSMDYSNHLNGNPVDYANQYILFGDPGINLYEPDSTPRIASSDPSSENYDGHTPGRGIPSVAVLGHTNYIPATLNELAIEHEFYSESNSSDFMWLLNLRRSVLIEPASLALFSDWMPQYTNEILDYVYYGGSLIIMGIDGNATWLPWSFSFSDRLAGSQFTLAEPQHPLITSPNSLGENITHLGTFTSYESNLTVLAGTENYPVLLAGVDGFGKVALTTLSPTGNSKSAFLENAALWYQQPSLMLTRIGLSQEIIWEGDRVTISFFITDRNGNAVSDAEVQARIGSIQVEARAAGTGTYEIVLDEKWTANRTGYYDLILNARKTGYDTLTLQFNDYLYIRPSPWLAVTIVGIGALVILGAWSYRKRRKGEKIIDLGGDTYSPPKNRKTKKEQEEEDEEFDIREFFGVE
ncbi:MAG: C25 family cysteine peptidase [Candidatus Thorarchaeota archaeon]